MISQQAIQKILGINDKVSMSAEEMVKEMKVVFFPKKGTGTTENVSIFSERLKNAFLDIGIEIVSYEDSLERVPFGKRIHRVVKTFANNARYIVTRIFGIKGEFYYI